MKPILSRPPPVRNRLSLYTEDQADQLACSRDLDVFAQDLREIALPYYSSYRLPECPTICSPGTPGKLLVMARRHACREQLWHPADGRMDDRQVIATDRKPTLESLVEMDQEQLAEMEDAQAADDALRSDSRFDAVARSYLVTTSTDFRERVYHRAA